MTGVGTGYEQELKEKRDAGAVEAALKALKDSASLTESTGDGANPQNLLNLAVEAARARCVSGCAPLRCLVAR